MKTVEVIDGWNVKDLPSLKKKFDEKYKDVTEKLSKILNKL